MRPIAEPRRQPSSVACFRLAEISVEVRSSSLLLPTILPLIE